MESFRDDNTTGYSQTELDELNREWNEIVKISNLEEFTDEYYDRQQQFDDEVARR